MKRYSNYDHSSIDDILLKYNDYIDSNSNKRPKFLLQNVNLLISKRLAGDELFNNAITLINDLNTINTNTDINLVDAVSTDKFDEKEINSNINSVNEEIIQEDDNNLYSFDDNNDITANIPSSDFDDLYGDIEEIGVIEEVVPDINNSDESSSNSLTLNDHSVSNNDTFDDNDDIEIDPLLSSLPVFPIPYVYQDLSINRLVTISTASKGQSITSFCIQKLPSLKKCFK